MDFMSLTNQIIFFVFVCGAAFVLIKIISKLLHDYCEKNPSFKAVSGIVIFLSNLIICFIALILIFEAFGIAVGPLLASLGISGLAVSLALVDVLKDLFSGIYIISDKNIKSGQYVILSSGEEGIVSEISWRVVKLRKKSGETIIIPNQKFYQASLTIK